ncbi:MAG: 30S ribosome-binding factor RbfA [Clostridia bacterium]|nr:30S ribosome-binding factor RbfA [Clostridia bacterium]
MAKYRKDRINDAVTEEVSKIIRDVKDPRVAGTMLTVTGAEVSGDLKFAKIFYSVLGEHDPKELKRGLRSVAPYIRSRLAESLNLRMTPELMFVYDESVARGAEISRILGTLDIKPEEDPDGDGENDG